MLDNDDTKAIYTNDGILIPWLRKTYENYLDKTTVIVGGSGSGKTTIVEEILYLCKDQVPNVLIIAPKTSHTAYIKKIHPRCIKEDLNKVKLEQIWNRQFYFTQIYNIANDISILADLFEKTNDSKAKLMIKAINNSANRRINEINSSNNIEYSIKKSQTIIIETTQSKQIKKIYQQTIRNNKSFLEKCNLTAKEKIALEYLDINPRLMLIIDDCSEKFKGWMKLFKKEESNPFESIFYRGRWNYITLIFAVHDDKLIDTELRKNARVTIFANSTALVSYTQKNCGFTNNENKLVMKIAGKVFGDEDGPIKTHQKVCYIREDNKPFKYTIANLYPDFRLGCDSLYELAEKMPKKKENLEENPFLRDINPDKKNNRNNNRKNNFKYV